MTHQNSSYKRVTLRDIAKTLGVSHVTVSLALRNAPQVSASRRKQIQEVAQSMGYRTNHAAKALGQQRRQTIIKEIAWFNPWSKPEQFRHYKEFDAYWKGASETAAQSGYHLTEYRCVELSSAELTEKLHTQNISGLLLPPYHEAPASWQDFPWAKYRFIRFGYSAAHSSVRIETSSRLHNGISGFEDIESQSYKRMGFVAGQRCKMQFKAGFLMKQLDLESSERIPILILPAEHTSVKNLTLLRDKLKSNRSQFAITDIVAAGDILNKAKYLVPEYEGLATSSVMDRKADAGIYQNSEEIGKIAMEMLIYEINRSPFGIPQISQETLIDA